MSDLDHLFGGDLSVSSTGDIAIVDGGTFSEQRIIRRLSTNAGAYVWALDYGAGLPAMVGDPTGLAALQRVVTEQMALEQGVDQTQPITVATTGDNLGTTEVTIGYTDAATGQPTTLTLPN